MTVTPTGPFSIPLHLLRAHLVASTAWQAWCGGASPAAAAAFLISCPSNLKGPHAIIDFDDNLARERDGQTVGPFTQRGGLKLYFCDDAGQQSNADAMTEFLNRVGAVLLDMEQMPPLGGSPMVVNGISLAGGPQRTAEEKRDKHQGDQLEVFFAVDVQVWP